MQIELLHASQGREYWEEINSIYGADNYIVMPHENEEYNKYALDYLENYLDKEKANNVVIMTFDKNVLDRLLEYSGKHKVLALKANKADIMHLLKFYALYAFTSKLTVISLTIPYNTCGENLLGVHGITKRELLCYDIYRFNEIPEIQDVWRRNK